MYASTEQRNRERVHVLADKLYRERYHYLLRIARRNGAGAGDADDVVNDAFAAFISKYDLGSGAPPLAWLTLCLKRASWAAYRSQRLDRRAGQEVESGSDEPGFCIADIPSEAAGVEETIKRAEDTIEARGRMAQLKPAERRALVLIAAGFSYKEIGELNRWSYTKVNRSAAEGRAALRAALAP